MFKSLLKYLPLLSVCLSLPLYANDTSATVAAGVITYNTTNDISMDSEALKISQDKITVTYKFTNHSDKDITSDVAFPLPPSPVDNKSLTFPGWVFPDWDEPYYAYSYVGENEADSKEIISLHDRMKSGSFVNFERSVDGTKFGFNSTIRAIDNNGNDITNTLRKNKIPLSSLYISGFQEESALDRDPDLKKKLISLKLLDKDNIPTWKTQIIYHWKQFFPAKKTITVSHSYKPYAGHQWLKFDQPINEALADYVVNNKDKNTILGMFNKNHSLIRLIEVCYILSTGSNWKGPIKSFSLEIIPANKNPLILTTLDQSIKKIKNRNYIINISNFKPNKELKILWLCYEL